MAMNTGDNSLFELAGRRGDHSWLQAAWREYMSDIGLASGGWLAVAAISTFRGGSIIVFSPETALDASTTNIEVKLCPARRFHRRAPAQHQYPI